MRPGYAGTMDSTTLSVPDISCDHCKMSIEGAALAVDGVHAATVDIEEKRVTISYDHSVGLDTIVTAIEEQGYDVAGPV